MKLNKPLPVEDLEFIKAHVPVDKLRSMYGVITGATGWFGNWICAALDYMGCEHGRVDTRSLFPFKCDYIIHLAPGDSNSLISQLQKTEVKHVLFTSSGSVYDETPSVNCIEKRTNENLFISSGLPVNIARCFSFIGAGVCQKDLAPGKFIKACLDNKEFDVYNPKSIRTYMYMADMVIWLLNILLADKGNVYDVGSTERITMLELAVKIKGKIGSNNSLWVGYGKDDPRPNYVPNLQFAHEDLGLRVYTDLDTAIDKTIAWERL
jgi:nucleoside-diphosphate-sugar epimerase